jgi:hypothetical protein
MRSYTNPADAAMAIMTWKHLDSNEAIGEVYNAWQRELMTRTGTGCMGLTAK